MASLNRVTLIGNIGQAPELRYTGSGKAVCEISVATTETWTDKQSGQKQEATEWHRIVFFGRLAEIAGEYATKGRQVFVEGKLKTEKWQDKEGKDRYTTKIYGDEIKLLGKLANDGGRQREERQASRQQTSSTQSAAPPAQQQFDDDDIPF